MTSQWCDKCWSYYRERKGEGGLVATLVLTKTVISDPEFQRLAGPNAHKNEKAANKALNKLAPLCCRYPDVLEWVKKNPTCSEDEAGEFIKTKFPDPT